MRQSLGGKGSLRKINEKIREKANTFNDIIYDRFNKHYAEPFEIEIEFKVGRSGNSYLFFDSVISHFTFLYVLGVDFFNISADHDERFYINIPIQKKHYTDANGEKDYFYLCGGIWDMPEKINFIVKKTDNPVIQIIKEKRIRINAGVLKNYKLPILYSNNKKYKITGIGDIEMIEKIMPKEINIGKKASIGYGECTWKIKSKNKFLLYDNNSQHYIRPVPIEYLKQKKLSIMHTIQSIYRPPYYGVYAKYTECGI